jgi:parvulin-like peptidyl-prolyl isomerase
MAFPSPLRQLPAFVFSAALILSFFGCHQAVTDPKDPRFIVVEGKNWSLTRSQLDNEVGAFLHEHQKTLQDVPAAQQPMLETDILNSMVIKRLILARAATLNLPDVEKTDAASYQQLKEHFPNEAEFQAQLKAVGMTSDQLKQQIHENTLVRRMIETEAIHNLPPPTDAEIEAFYLQNKDKLTVPDKIRASRILILVDDKASPADRAAKKKSIDRARARVMKGEDFSKVASEVSEDRYSAPKGGDIGYFQKGENEASFDQVAFTTKPGVVSAVFETPMGYQFIKVTDVHPGGVVSIAQAREVIAKALLQEKQKQALESYTKNLLATSGVTFHLVRVNPNQLPGALPAPAATH